MGVQKFRSVAEMPRPPVDSDIPLDVRIAATWERAHPNGPHPLPRGVMKFRAIEDAQKARREWTRQRLSEQGKVPRA